MALHSIAISKYYYELIEPSMVLMFIYVSEYLIVQIAYTITDDDLSSLRSSEMIPNGNPHVFILIRSRRTMEWAYILCKRIKLVLFHMTPLYNHFIKSQLVITFLYKPFSAFVFCRHCACVNEAFINGRLRVVLYVMHRHKVFTLLHPESLQHAAVKLYLDRIGADKACVPTHALH